MTNAWRTDTLDLDAYLRRIGHPRVAASAKSLDTLHAAHVRTIPFENVDVLLGDHPGLGLDAIQAKLVDRRRGGYCFEHALLFAAALEQLGFTVERRIARVNPDGPGPRTHMLLLVRVDGEEFLADVGFGSGMLHPMPLQDGVIVDQAGWHHRLTQDGDLWTLSKRTPDGWTARHASDSQPQQLVDYAVAHHYVSTHPSSPFVGQLVVIRLGEGVIRALIGDQLKFEYPDRRTEQRTISPDEVDQALRGLDVELTADELSRLRARLG